MASIQFEKETLPDQVAIPLEGGLPKRLCTGYCISKWSPNGQFLLIAVEAPSRTSLGRNLAIPVGPGESLPELPPTGIGPTSTVEAVRGSHTLDRADLVPGNDLTHCVCE